VGEGGLAGVVAERLDPIQAYSFMLFVLLYTPCLSTVATLRQESRSWGFTLLAVLWPLAVAWLASFAFYQVARALTNT
jgi:ferrous iron transport protein B